MTPERVTQRKTKLAVWLRDGLVKLGPTFIKIGQQFSTRVDVLSAEFIRELEQLQDSVPAFDPDDAIALVEKDLGAPVLSIFESFEREPVAAASLGQVSTICPPPLSMLVLYRLTRLSCDGPSIGIAFLRWLVSVGSILLQSLPSQCCGFLINLTSKAESSTTLMLPLAFLLWRCSIHHPHVAECGDRTACPKAPKATLHYQKLTQLLTAVCMPGGGAMASQQREAAQSNEAFVCTGSSCKPEGRAGGGQGAAPGASAAV